MTILLEVFILYTYTYSYHVLYRGMSRIVY